MTRADGDRRAEISNRRVSTLRRTGCSRTHRHHAMIEQVIAEL